jgi:hypothetical protein
MLCKNIAKVHEPGEQVLAAILKKSRTHLLNIRQEVGLGFKPTTSKPIGKPLLH